MYLLSITNRTASRLPVSSLVGILEPNSIRKVEMTQTELDLSCELLNHLASLGLLLWSLVAIGCPIHDSGNGGNGGPGNGSGGIGDGDITDSGPTGRRCLCK